MRYSGSLLKYSFSEVKQKKSVAVLDLKDKDINIELRELNPFRDLRIIKGNIEIPKEVRDKERKKKFIKYGAIGVAELKAELARLQEQYNDPVRFSPDRDKE